MNQVCRRKQKFFLLIVLMLTAGTAHTGDISEEWISRDPGITSLVWDISFADDNNGWLCGLCAISKTNNSGRTWKSCWESKDAFWFNSIAAMSGKSAVTAGFAYGRKSPGTVMRTSDGGNTWQAVLTGSSEAEQFSSVTFFPGRLTGFVISTTRGLLVSNDGGETWSQNPSPLPQNPGAYIASKREINVIGDKLIVVPCGPWDLAFSEDRGKTWKIVPLPKKAKNPSGLISRIHFCSPQNGWVSFLNGDTLRTTDKGITWSMSRAPGLVFMQDQQNGWAISEFEVCRTTNGGKTWSKPVRISGGDTRLESMVCTTRKVYIVGGCEGTSRAFLSEHPLSAGTADETGIIPIRFRLPGDGFATIQVLDEKGNVVQNVVAGQHFNSGAHTVYWDLGTLNEFWPPFRKSKPFLWEPPADAKKIASPGKYLWRGLYHPGFSLEYRYSYYPLRKNGVAWLSSDRRGGWLADHEPPRTLVRNGNSMWIGAFNEEGDTLIQADLEMCKLWGTQRIQLACPKALASDADSVYFFAQGGWLSFANQKAALIQVNSSRQSRRLFAVGNNDLSNQDGDLSGVEGMAVQGNRVYLADRTGNRILVVDISDNLSGKNENMKIISSVPVKTPGRMRPYVDGRIALVSGKSVVLFDPKTEEFATAVSGGLENPLGLGVDDDGNFYAGDMEPCHQVKVFDRAGRLLRTIGTRGGHRIGKFNPDNLELPADVDVDPRGNVWVCEWNPELKRVSVWDKQGHCINQVLGPTEYGGGGSLDPLDENRAFFAGKEFRRNPETGEVRLEKILWRYDDTRYDRFVEHRPHNFNGPSPEYPFWRNGKLFFSLWGAYAMGEITVLWVYTGDELRPVAAVGAPPKWLKERIGVKDADAKSFAWTDRNDDGRVQADEVTISSFDPGSAVWGVRMNQDFSVAFSSLSGDVGISFCKPAEITDKGYPVYHLPTGFKMIPGFQTYDPNQIQNVYTDRKGNAVVISPFIFSMSPAGKVNWRYVCRWPGLHAGRNTTSYGDEPGVLVSPLRCYGSAVVNSSVGELLCYGTDYGATHFITADGLYAGRGFTDCRRGISWSFNTPPRPSELSTVSLDQEHFGGSFQAAKGRDGKTHFLYVVAPGGPTAVVVEQKGLDKIRRLEGAGFNVTSADCKRAMELRASRAVDEKTESKIYVIRKTRGIQIDGNLSEWPAERTDGFSMLYDDKFLYVSYDGPDDRAPFRNAASEDDWKDAFRKGDVIDIYIGSDPNASSQRQKPAQGDERLSIVPFGETAKAVLYDYVVPGVKEKDRVEFTSPWWVTTIDSVAVIPGAGISVVRRSDGFSLEAAIPVSALHLDPAKIPVVSGDFGRCISEQTGTRTVERRYWNDNSTLMIGDIAVESRIIPAMWGQFRFE